MQFFYMYEKHSHLKRPTLHLQKPIHTTNTQRFQCTTHLCPNGRVSSTDISAAVCPSCRPNCSGYCRHPRRHSPNPSPNHRRRRHRDYAFRPPYCRRRHSSPIRQLIPVLRRRLCRRAASNGPHFRRPPTMATVSVRYREPWTDPADLR